MNQLKQITDFIEIIFSYKISELLIAALVAWAGVIFVRKSVHHFFKRTHFIEERKEQTLESIINSIAKYTATIGFIFYAFSVFGVHFGKMLAGAGVIGIIVGFGAQSLIKDVLSGIFLLYEKQLHKGDFIAINSKYTGTVEEIGLRFLKVREWSGKLLTISNGEVKEIQNYNINRMRVIEKVTVSFYENPTRMFELLTQACEQLNQDLAGYLKKDFTHAAIEPFQVFGITSLNSNFKGYEYTITALVDDNAYWDASKETRKIVAQIMYDNNVQMAEDKVRLQPGPEVEKGLN